MDITRDNFMATLPDIAEAIDKADFISIDGEFTGLTNGAYNLTVYDSPEERYHKLFFNTENFLLIQFGLSAFRWDESDGDYKVQAYNFYIFPSRSSISGAPDRVFSCQSSSLDFLIQQGFDFNKAFKKGIPFLHEDEEMSLRLYLEEKQAVRDASLKSPSKTSQQVTSAMQSPATRSPKPTIITDHKTKEFAENTCKVVKKFLDDEKEAELLLEPCNSYLRKILFETLPKKFPDQILVESRVDDQTHQRHLVVVRGADEETKKARQEEQKQREDNELENAIGFSRVIKILKESQKIIVGHNIFLDLLYTVKQFVCVLPPSLEDFKSVTVTLFPQVIDTKLIASLQPFKNLIPVTGLGDMSSRLRKAPFTPASVEAPGKYNNGSQDSQDINLHEAAYDAYVTGFAFLTMLYHLGSMQKSKQPVVSFEDLKPLTTPYINKLFLMRMHDVPYLNLSGPDLSPPRDHVFHVEFPPSWKASDVRQLFSPVGQVNISWINETRCFVGLYDKTQVQNVKDQLIKTDSAEPPMFRICPYAEYQAHNTSPLSYTRTQNRTWRRDGSSNTAPVGSGRPSTSNGAQQPTKPTLTSPTPLSTPLEKGRKRGATNLNTTENSPHNKTIDEIPSVKKQRADGESENEAAISSTSSSSTIFEVPEW